MKQFMNRPIVQYAWVVDDLDAACRRWTALFGAGPFFTMRHHRVAGYFRYRGGAEQCDVSYAFGYSGPVQIQLIQAHDDIPSIYSEMFKPGEQGFHHVAVFSEDFAADKQQMLDQGLEVAVELWSGADVAYLDARPQIGCFVEIIAVTPAVRDFFAGWKRAHDDWDGTTTPIRDAEELHKA
jgi:hypothetical protein